jgi:DNA-binding LacI/PurR family transcriptional regulator
MALTIRDVARAAGVSTATVSRALRGIGNVDPRTRSRIIAIAQEMKFSISPTASRLASGRTGVVGIVTPYIGRWYFTEVFAGLEAGLAPYEVELLLHATGLPGTPPPEIAAGIRLRRRVDGVIVLGLPPEMVASEGLLDLDVPVVVLGSHTPGVASVRIDDREGARTAVRHLVERGHERIGLISGRRETSMFVPENDRLAGYLDVLGEAGLAAPEELREYGHFTLRGGEQAMAALLATERRPTAVFCMSDEMAFGAVRAMNRQHVVAGRELALIGFDGHDLASAFDLSTIEQPVRELGHQAAQVLMRAIAGPGTQEQVLLPTVLVQRGSTGALLPR